MNSENCVTVFIHSQSDNPIKPGSPNSDISLKFEGDPSEQAFATRAFDCFLQNPQEGIFVTDFPIPEDYYTVLATLGFDVETIKKRVITVEDPEPSLSKKVIAQKEFILQRIDEIADGKTPILSVFTPTMNEVDLVNALKIDNEKVKPEFSTLTRLLVNKARQQKALKDIQVNGKTLKLRHKSEVFFDGRIMDLKKISDAGSFAIYLEKTYKKNTKLFFKHPYSTAGEGLWGYNVGSEDEDNLANLQKVYELIQNKNAIVLEQEFSGATEHSLHLRIDPITQEVSYIGSYEQAVTENGHGGYSHSGCIFPAKDLDKAEFMKQVAGPIGQMLKEMGATGDMCLDVLVRKGDDCNLEIHVMEINTRTGANLYALRLSKAVLAKRAEKSQSESFVSTESKQPYFELEASVKLKNITTVTDLFEQYPELKDLVHEGKLLLSNYGRFQFGSWDMIYLSDTSHDEVAIIKQKVKSILYSEQ